MNKINITLLLIVCSQITFTRDHHPITPKENQNYGHEITIKNLSPAKLTISVKNDPYDPTIVTINGNDTGSILVKKPKLRVHIEANYDGKILKTNLKRKKDSENYWEIRIRKAIIDFIEVAKRESRPKS